MTTTTPHPLARAYLERLRKAASPLPKPRREELVSDIEAHLTDSLPPGATEAEVRTVLDRLGDPEEIVLAEDPRLARPRTRRGVHEWFAILLLPFGGVVIPVVGWLAGVLLLWTSDAWTRRDKLIGTLVIPGGYLLPVYLFLLASSTGSSESGCVTRIDATGRPVHPTNCTGSSGGSSPVKDILTTMLAIVILLLPLITSIYLARRARPNGAAPATDPVP